MAPKYVDPDLAVHPLRLTMSDEDWDRLDRIFTKDSDESMSDDEIEAYMDWLYDEIAVRKQTHFGVTTLQ